MNAAGNPLTAIVLLMLCSQFFAAPAASQTTRDCVSGTALSHEFPSGARWSMCAELNETFGLHLTQLHYFAPGDTDRQTFSELHLAGLLEHFHDEETERSVFANTQLGGQHFINFNEDTCPGELVVVPTTELDSADQNVNNKTVCIDSYADKILAKFNNDAVVQSHRWDIIGAAANGFDAWEVVISLGEEGTITPTINRSGVVHRFTTQSSFGSMGVPNNMGTDPYAVSSTVLATWRIVPGMGPINSTQTAEQLDFTLRPDLGNRRPMNTAVLPTETLRQVNREQFRRWLVRGSDGAGYTLDVQNNGFQYRSKQFNWALFDVAFTRFNACELMTLNNLGNSHNNSENSSVCGESLEDFVSGESLENATPVIWFSQSMPIVRTAEDVPLMQTRSLSFDLVPFDWTENSPFAPNTDPIIPPSRDSDNGL